MALVVCGMPVALIEVIPLSFVGFIISLPLLDDLKGISGAFDFRLSLHWPPSAGVTLLGFALSGLLEFL